MKSPQILEFPRFLDERGNLSFIEQPKQIPFSIKRVYWIYDVPGGEIRGGHSFKKQEEVVIAMSGSFDIVVSNGEEEVRYHLNRSFKGLYIPPGHWRYMDNFSTNTVVLVLSSTFYDENDYVRNKNDFYGKK